MPEDKSKEIVKLELTRYLESKGYRKTPERYAILECIYSTGDHFDVDSLHERMAHTEYRVSRATVYNTIDLLIDAGLVRKHQFGFNPAQYERCYNMNNHHHLICTRCGKVQEVKDAELLHSIANKKFSRFTTAYYALYVYGLCNRCLQNEKRKKRKPAESRKPAHDPVEKTESVSTGKRPERSAPAEKRPSGDKKK